MSEHAWKRNLTTNAAWDEQLRGPRGDWWWTGPQPQACAGFAEGTLTSLPLPNLATASVEQVLAYFENTWALDELLLSSLQGAEAFYQPPAHRLRHPMVFYYGHTAVFYVNKLRVAGMRAGPVNAHFEKLFEVGVDEMTWDDYTKADIEWPTVQAIHSYRGQVFRLFRQAIVDHYRPGIGWDDPEWALFMAMEHERIHIETSSVLIRELPLSLIRRPEEWPPRAPVGAEVAAMGFVLVEGPSVLGKERSYPTYGWDNEYGHEVRQVPGSLLGDRLVSNAEYQRFVASGGYRQRNLWSEDGWGWRRSRNAKWPSFWSPVGPEGLHQYSLRSLFEELPLPADWPAVVNHHEASAYCAWLSEQEGQLFRLPTEAEHGLMRGRQEVDPASVFDGRGFAAQGVNLNLAWGSEGSVLADAPNAAGFHGVAGNVWQWIADDMHPLEGSRVHPYYDDFTSPCYGGEHRLILGGSFVSTGDEASQFARYQFRPHFAQHAGFRVARSVVGPADGEPRRVHGLPGSAAYETDALVGMYMNLHWGEASDQMPFPGGPVEAIDFPVRCAEVLLRAASAHGISGRALDVGCATGRTTLELARRFDEVVGVDLSAAFIDAATEMKTQGHKRWYRVDQGALGTWREAVVPPEIDRDRVRFQRADACALPADLSGFDAVFLGNLLDRLVSPRAFLDRLTGPLGLVRPGGLVAVTTPFTWLEDYTPKEAWLGAQEIDGVEVSSGQVLKELMAEHFELIEEGDMPFVIRETARKYQYVVAHMFLWRHLGE